MIQRVRPHHVLAGALDRLDGSPWVCDCRNIDISDTIAAMIRNAPAGMVAISIRPDVAQHAKVERAARKRGTRIIWLRYGKALRMNVMPIRIQRSRAKGWRMPKNAVYVGRPTRWGNPFYWRNGLEAGGGNGGWARGCSVDLFREWLIRPAQWPDKPLPPLTADIRAALRGRDLVCWCPLISHSAYVPCHADVLLALANDIPMDEVIRENTRRAEGQAVRSGDPKPTDDGNQANVAE